MARIRQGCALILSLTLWAAVAVAEEQPPNVFSAPTTACSVLVVDPGMHTAMINSTSADGDGTWVVTGSDDKTVRIWSLADGALARTIRLPAGPGNVGKVYAGGDQPRTAHYPPPAAGPEISRLLRVNRSTCSIGPAVDWRSALTGLPQTSTTWPFPRTGDSSQ